MCESQRKALRSQFSSAILLDMEIEFRPWGLWASGYPLSHPTGPEFKILNTEAQNSLSPQAPKCPSMKMKVTGKIRNMQTFIGKEMDPRIRSIDNVSSELAHQGFGAAAQKCIFNFKRKKKRTVKMNKQMGSSSRPTETGKTGPPENLRNWTIQSSNWETWLWQEKWSGRI